MFSEMVAELTRGTVPAPGALRKRFDFALIKKMGVIKLPSAFWTGDPKINPRSDHLFWAALLLMDRERIDLALAVIAAEEAEKTNSGPGGCRPGAEKTVRALIDAFFQQVPDIAMRRSLRRGLRRIIPEWLEDIGGKVE